MIKVTGHRVLVKEDPVETKIGSIYIVQDEKLERATAQHGVIVDLGPDCWKAYRKIDREGMERNGEPWAKVGDYVIFARHAGRFIADPVTEDEFLIMNDEDILAIITEGNNIIPTHPIRDKVIASIGE